MVFGACSDVGKVRKENEDGFYVPGLEDRLKMFLIADGIGGQSHGKLAAMMAIDSIVKYSIQNKDKENDKSKLLLEAVNHANETVKRFSAEGSEFTGMGTTLVAMLLDGEDAVITNAGDSRCYMIRKGIISQLTIDHSYVQYLLEKGVITTEEAQNHPQKNLITKAIGLEDEILLETEKIKLLSGDILLLCTDGLTTMLSDEEILHIIMKKSADMQNASEALVRRAKEKGGTDNITAILVEV